MQFHKKVIISRFWLSVISVRMHPPPSNFFPLKSTDLGLKKYPGYFRLREHSNNGTFHAHINVYFIIPIILNCVYMRHVLNKN